MTTLLRGSLKQEYTAAKAEDAARGVPGAMFPWQDEVPPQQFRERKVEHFGCHEGWEYVGYEHKGPSNLCPLVH